MAAQDVGVGTVDLDGLAGDVLAAAGQEEHEGRPLVEVVLHHGLGRFGGQVGGVAIAGAATGQPFFHGRIGADVARRGVPAQMFVAAHDALTVRVDDGRAVPHGDGVHRAAEILGARGHPALFQAGELGALTEADGVARAHAVGAHPDLRAAVGAVGGIGLVQGTGPAGADHRGLGAEDVELAVTHAEAHGAGAAAFVHDEGRGRHAVVDVRAALQGFLGHDGLELLAVDGDVPLAAVADAALLVAQDGQAPAFQIVHGLVELAGIGKGQILTQGAAAHLGTAPAHQVFGGLAFGDVGIDGVHTGGTGTGAHDLGLFHAGDADVGIHQGGFRGHEAAGIAAADDEQVGLDDDGLDIVQVFRGELAHVRRRDVGHDVLL